MVTSAGCLPKSVMPTASMQVRVPKPTFCKTAALYARGHVKSQMCRSFPGQSLLLQPDDASRTAA